MCVAVQSAVTMVWVRPLVNCRWVDVWMFEWVKYREILQRLSADFMGKMWMRICNG